MGKSSLLSVPLGEGATVKAWSIGVALRPGLIWSLVRGSAPAEKWQLAQAWPSEPSCWSQKSDLPSWRRAVRSATYSLSLGSSGSLAVLREARGEPVSSSRVKKQPLGETPPELHGGGLLAEA